MNLIIHLKACDTELTNESDHPSEGLREFACPAYSMHCFLFLVSEGKYCYFTHNDLKFANTHFRISRKIVHNVSIVTLEIRWDIIQLLLCLLHHYCGSDYDVISYILAMYFFATVYAIPQAQKIRKP